ncbi:MAG TPA: ribosomal protein S18-alanine N-acetyltransferase [Gemmatimonadaceae bacterium]|nr:ribosomal protein S18-alanine N-acetyltransferase [Gemmatimonadaceae bacterium]
MNALLRPVVESDLTAITSIERASFADPWTEESFRRLLDAQPAIFLVVESEAEGALAGYVVAFSVGEDGEILNLAVAAPFRGRGLAGQMLDAVLIELTGRGVRAAFLEVRESNDAARGLYGSRNFAEIGRRRGYYRRPVEDAIVLRRVLEVADEEAGRPVGTFADR